MKKPEHMYNPFDKMTFAHDKCFLCGSELSTDNQADEHIYPKWLQNMFNLWNKELVLLNGTSIRYRQLKIPCCKSCNGRMSSLFEKPIERAVTCGYDEIITLDRDLIFLWLNKLSYGMLFKELSLDLSRSEPEKGKIYSAEYLKEHRMQYMFLQTILSQATYTGRPYSMLIFKIDPCGVESYWSHDNPFLKTFFIRMNNVGIISQLMDNGFNEDFFLQYPKYEELLHKVLHPIQFAEICARFLYKCSLFYRNPSYIMMMNGDQKPEMIISQGISGYGYGDWEQKKFAEVLTNFWEPYGLNFDDVYKGDDKVWSLLHREDGAFIDVIKNNGV